MWRRLILGALLIAVFGITAFIFLMPVVHQAGGVIVVSPWDDEISCDHVIFTLKQINITPMGALSLNHDGAQYSVPIERFDDAVQRLKESAEVTGAIEILGFDKRGAIWIRRGPGQEFDVVLDTELNLGQIPTEYSELLRAVKDSGLSKELENSESKLDRVYGSMRTYIGRSGHLEIGYDLALVFSTSDLHDFTELYQLRHDLKTVEKLSRLQ